MTAYEEDDSFERVSDVESEEEVRSDKTVAAEISE